MDVLGLLQTKNRCLSRFITLTEKFLETSENGDLSSLAEFEENREAVVKTVQLFDRKITEAVNLLRPQDRTPELISSVRRSIAQTDALLATVISTDSRVLTRITEEKNRILRDLSSSEKNKSMVNKFRSGWVPESGAEIDKKL